MSAAGLSAGILIFIVMMAILVIVLVNWSRL